MAKKIVMDGCVAKCDKVGEKRECSISVPIYGSDRCRLRTKDEFDESSFFSKKSGKATIIIGCPKNKFDEKRRRCTVGTRAYKMIL